MEVPSAQADQAMTNDSHMVLTQSMEVPSAQAQQADQAIRLYMVSTVQTSRTGAQQRSVQGTSRQAICSQVLIGKLGRAATQVRNPQYRGGQTAWLTCKPKRG